MNYEDYTLVELRQLAKEKGEKNVSKLKREELYKILDSHNDADVTKNVENENSAKNDIDIEVSSQENLSEKDIIETRIEEGYTLSSNDRIAEGILEILPDGYGF